MIMYFQLARDKSGYLLLFENTPIRKGNGFYSLEGCYYVLLGDLFPEVTWENSPQEVELKLIKNDKRRNYKDIERQR